MNNKPITLSKIGTEIFNADQAWLDYCEENDIRSPWIDLDSLYNEYTHYNYAEDGSINIIMDDMTEEQKIRQKELEKYRDEYLSEKHIFIGQFLLNTNGYNALTFFAQAHYPSDSKFQEWYHTIKPCEGFEGQCDLFCPIFCECEKGD